MSKNGALGFLCVFIFVIGGITSVIWSAEPPVDIIDDWAGLEGASICGETDDRYSIDDHRAARMNGCSAVMLEGGVFLSAGHCFIGPEVLELEFRVPLSDNEGNITRSAPEDIWIVDRETAILDYGDGRDYAIFRVYPNNQLLFPEDVYGPGFEISSPPESSGARLSMVLGYGKTSRWWGDQWSQTLRADDGPIKWITDQHVYYPIDTEIASSGSGVVFDDKLFGVHIAGGCTTKWKVNRGYRVDQPHIVSGIKELRN